MFDINDKIAVVTGGYGHLGSAISKALLSQNALVIVGGRSKEKFDERFDQFPKNRLFFRKLDISDSNSIKAFFTEVVDDFGRVDILFNNAHFARGFYQENMPDQDWSYTMEGVLGSVHKCIREVIPIMKAQKSGKIINVSSMYGLVSPDFSLYKGSDCEKYTNPPHYGAAKAAVIQLTKYFAVYLGKYNIHVNAITPGPFPKEQIQKDNPEFIKRLKLKNPLKKIGTPKDIGGVSILLSSGASDFITGQNFIIDGGWTIW